MERFSMSWKMLAIPGMLLFLFFLLRWDMSADDGSQSGSIMNDAASYIGHTTCMDNCKARCVIHTGPLPQEWSQAYTVVAWYEQEVLPAQDAKLQVRLNGKDAWIYDVDGTGIASFQGKPMDEDNPWPGPYARFVQVRAADAASVGKGHDVALILNREAPCAE